MPILCTPMKGVDVSVYHKDRMGLASYSKENKLERSAEVDVKTSYCNNELKT
jgi:hypothetical protein